MGTENNGVTGKGTEVKTDEKTQTKNGETVDKKDREQEKTKEIEKTNVSWCRYGNKCQRGKSCRFRHRERVTQGALTQTHRDKHTTTSEDKKQAHEIEGEATHKQKCWNGPNCLYRQTKKGCDFYHPERREVTRADEMHKRHSNQNKPAYTDKKGLEQQEIQRKTTYASKLKYTEENQKNWRRGMQDDMHSLQTNLKKMIEEMREMKKNMGTPTYRKKRYEEDRVGKTH